MPVLIRDGESILFIHIPKCGGSSFEAALADRGWRELLSIKGLHPDQLRFLCCSPQHWHAELLLRLVRPEAFTHVVTLVREPLARLRSEYAWQLAQGMTTLGPEAWVEHVFAAYRKDPFACDNHLRPQCEFLIDGSLRFKLEEDGVERALAAVSPGPLAGGLRARARRFRDRLLGRPRQKRLKATSRPPEVEAAFERMRGRIQDFYSDDYAALGYARQD